VFYLEEDKSPNIDFNLTYLGVTTLAKARFAPPKTQVKSALDLQTKKREENDLANGRKRNRRTIFFCSLDESFEYEIFCLSVAD